MAEFNPKIEISIKDLPEVQRDIQEARDEIERLNKENAGLKIALAIDPSRTFVLDLRVIANALGVGMSVESTRMRGLIMEKIKELKDHNETQSTMFRGMAVRLGVDVPPVGVPFTLDTVTSKIDEMKEHIAALASARDTELHWEEQVAHELGLPGNNRLILGAVKDLKKKLEVFTSSTINVVSWDGSSTIALACSDEVLKAWLNVQVNKDKLYTILGGMPGAFGTTMPPRVLWKDVIAKVVEEVKMANVASMADAEVQDLARQLREVRSVVGASAQDNLPEFIMRKFEVLTIHDETDKDLHRLLRCTTQDLNATRAKVEKLERQIEKFKKEQARGEKWENNLRTVLGIAPAHTPGASIIDAVIAIYAERDKYRNEAAKWEAQARVAKKQERDRADEIF